MNKKVIVMALTAIVLLLGVYLYKKFNVAPSINFDALELYDLDTNKVAFKNLKGKKLIVSFGASWCPNCIDELNTLKKIKTNKPQTYVVLISELDNLSMIGETFNLGSFDYIIKSEDAQEKMQHILKEIQLKKYKKKSSSN